MLCASIAVKMWMKKTMTTRSYQELRRLRTFGERYNYLRLRSSVGVATFGFDRHLNQRFYGSREWKIVRDEVIVRDNGCDLGVLGFDIHFRPTIHHMNPIILADLQVYNEDILNPDYLITTTHRTHNAIHYGDDSQLLQLPKERRPGDTKLW